MACNREQKRKYTKIHKNDKNATYCWYCDIKTLSKTDSDSNLCCELCGRMKKNRKELLK
jgi:hypothetical protein